MNTRFISYSATLGCAVHIPSDAVKLCCLQGSFRSLAKVQNHNTRGANGVWEGSLLPPESWRAYPRNILPLIKLMNWCYETCNWGLAVTLMHCIRELLHRAVVRGSCKYESAWMIMANRWERNPIAATDVWLVSLSPMFNVKCCQPVAPTWNSRNKNLHPSIWETVCSYTVVSGWCHKWDEKMI